MSAQRYYSTRQSERARRMENQSCTAQRTPEALGYTLGKTLGSGTYAKVMAAWSPHQRKMIAIKVLNKKAASNDYLTKFLPREIDIIRSIHHPNIIQLHGLFKSDSYCYFLMELAENGDLLDYINGRSIVPEEEARHIFRQMARAVTYCHSHNIVHRDLKCENVMLSRDMDVKIGDFGFALRVDVNPAKTPCGSYSYAAPELFTTHGDGYDGKKADIWSMGVILYAVVCGRLPFGDDAQVKMTQERRLVFSHRISLECRGYLRCLLSVSVEDRIASTNILQHLWPSMEPIKRPLPIVPPPSAKYTVENCFPYDVQFPRLAPLHVSSNNHGHADSLPLPPVGVSMRHGGLYTQAPSHVIGPIGAKSGPRPLVAKIGACGRRIADAVKQHRGGGTQQQKDSEQSLPKRTTL